MKKILLLLLLFTSNVFANNLQISSPTFAERNTTLGYAQIQFNISWDNSWRTSNLNDSGITNWDAVWLFVKYKRTSDGLWYHATLNLNTNLNSAGSLSPNTVLDIRNDGKGAYIHRNTEGSGTLNSNNVILCWNYANDGLDINSFDNDIDEIRVFGIEMVYIAQGAFYIGDGNINYKCFYTYGANTPYLVNSESEINIANTNGSLWCSDYIEVSTLPALYPKGYNAFYCMKYEVTQEQYADFLNTLTVTQQNARVPSGAIGYRFIIKKVNNIFGCDANNNSILNEANDGQNIPCIYLSWIDGSTYADWACLRPMTEFEYEKACRGPEAPVLNGYAWGGTLTGLSPTYLLNKNYDNEIPSDTNKNNCMGGQYGPVRVGCFRSGTRLRSGAGFYGVMELSGNAAEQTITVANNAGRSFTGLNGDGVIDATGIHNVPNWPGADGIGSMLNGGAWLIDSPPYWLAVSHRNLPNVTNNRGFNNGFRCVGSL